MTFHSATQMIKIAIRTNLYDSCETYLDNPTSFLSLEFLPSKSCGAFNTAHSFASENKLPLKPNTFPWLCLLLIWWLQSHPRFLWIKTVGTQLLIFWANSNKTCPRPSLIVSLSPLRFVTENPVNICAFSKMALQPLSCTNFNFPLFCHPHLGILPLIQISTLAVYFFSSRVCDLY